MRGSYYNSNPIRTGEDYVDLFGARWVKREAQGYWATSLTGPEFVNFSRDNPTLADQFRTVEVNGETLHISSIPFAQMDEILAIAA